GLRTYHARLLPEFGPDGDVTSVLNVARDVTDLLASRDANARLAAIVESSADAVVATGLDDCVVSWNAAAERLFGYTAAEAIGQLTPIALLPSGESADAHDASAGFETSINARDGREVPVSVTHFPIHNAEGSLIGRAALVRDISARKAEEAALREREESFRLLFYRNPLPMWVIEPGTTRFLEVNDMAVRTYGYSREEFLSMTSIDLRDPDERERYLKFLAAGGQELEGDVGIWRHRKKDGRRISVQVRGHTLTFEGLPARLIIAEDVTERLAAQSAAAQLSAIVESSNDAIISRDRDGRIVSWNPAAERLFGYAEAEALGKGGELLNPAENPASARGFQRALRGESFTVSGAVRYAKDGRRLELDVSVFPIYGEGPEVDAVGIIARDMSAERKAELASAQLAAIVGSSNDAVVSRDLDGAVISWNPAAERIYGYTAEEAIGRGPDFLAPPGRIEEIQRRISETAAGGPASTYEAIRWTKDGREIVLSMSLFPVRSDAGEVIAVAAISRDITAEREAEREMARLAALVASSEDAIVSVDLNGHFVTWNNAAERLFGYTAEEALGRPSDLLQNPPELEVERQSIRASLEAGRSVVGVETFRVRKDGSRVEVSASYFPIRDAAGEVIGLANVTQDITERKATERTLAHLASIVNATDDAITTVDLDRRYTSWNRGAERLFGYTESEVLGLGAGLLYPPEMDVDAERAIVWNALNAGGTVRDVESVRRRKDGSLVDVAVSYFPIADGAGRVIGFANISRDITDRKAAAEALRTSHERYEFATRATNDAIWDWDLPTDALHWSAQFSELFGYPPGAIVPTIQFWEGLIHPADRERVVSSLNNAVAGTEEHWQAEYPLLRADGSYARVADRGYIQRDAAGTATRMIGAIADVTERTLAAEALVASEARLRAVIDTAPAAVWAWDADGVFFVNRALIEMTGYTEAELMAPGFLQGLVHPLDQDAVTEDRIAYQDGSPRPSDLAEFRYVRASGEVRALRMMASPLDFDWRPGFLSVAYDITEERAAREALEESEARFRAVIEAVPAGVWAWDESGIFFVNDAMSRIMGYPRERLFEPDFMPGLLYEDDRALLGEHVSAWARRDPHAAWNLEHRFVRGDGEVRWLRLTATPVTIAGRDGTLAAAFDITEERQAQEAVVASEARFRSVIETVSAGVWIWDGTTITFVNQALCDITGYTAAELTAPNFFNTLLHPDDRRAIFERGLARLRGEEVEGRYEGHIVTKGGELRTIDISATAIQFDGSPASLVTVFDVTDNRRMQEALRESEARFRAVLETVATGIWIWDGASMSYVNDALVRITGFPREQLMDGHTFDSVVVHPDDRAMIRQRGNARIRGEDVPKTYELRVVRPGGEVRHLEITATLIDLGGRPVSLASAVDLTDRHLAEEERRRFDQQVQHAQKLESLGILAGGIAHDFNNLLVGVLGNAGLALMELPPDSPARRTITDIETAAKRAADLTRQMLAYSGKGQFVVETVDLSNVVREMAALLEVSISKRVTVRYDFPAGLPHIEADATQLRQVIMNLLTNASDAIGDGDGLITVRTGTFFADRAYLAETYLDNELPEGTYVSLEVSDTGSGMDPETRARIFDPFFSTKFTGRGLGLAAVLGIIRGHRGAIKVYSEPGRGTTFRVLFPPAESAGPAPSAPAEATRLWSDGGTILIVDDDYAVRSVTARMLELAGFSTIIAEDGNRALELFDLHKESIDLVLLDLTMPGMDGEQTFRALRLRQPSIRVVLTSGYSEQDATNRFVGEGLAGFLQKPFRHQDLIDTLREVLEA
ncbi:MAG: PAS domain S-box protein, partial [Tepidiformaceae bacterium]